MLFLLLAGGALLFVSTASAKTWFLGPDEQWEQVSSECERTFVQANTFLEKGKLAKAYKGYEKFMKSCDPNSTLYAEALQREFYIGKEYLGGRKITVLGVFKIRGYAAGEKIMDRISERAGDKPIGMDAAVEVAKSYEDRGKRDEAYYDIAHLRWYRVFDTYDKDARASSSGPTGVIGRDSLLAMARCKQNAYRGPAYDASGLAGRVYGPRKPYDNARACYQEFKSRYGRAEQVDIDQKLQQINEHLALKDLTTGKYYQKTGNQQAANLYYQMVIRNWPATQAAKKANQMLLRDFTAEEKKNEKKKSKK
jgi:outer membrane protein assembly factor BamD (BamD/ComL family)